MTATSLVHTLKDAVRRLNPLGRAHNAIAAQIPSGLAGPVTTEIPGRSGIPLIAYYPRFARYYRDCELATKAWFVDQVREDWWIIDAGANIGYYAILFGQLAPRGRVIAFEPTGTVEMLKENIAHNRVTNITVEKLALGMRTGRAIDGIFRIWGKRAELRSYRFYRLDDYVREHAIPRIDCIKIDVDSFDFEVLRGAEETLRRFNPYVVVELNHALAQRHQSNMEALRWLAGLGYREALVTDGDNFILKRGAAVGGSGMGLESITLHIAAPNAAGSGGN